ncbi:MAG: type III-B CRISPR module-associated protein Cmr5 [Deltaproteobacteria bacterium]|nr:type III-B CRISPR module-associated protein Cmr5 [Deltaproteobacteria bacterium]
MPGRLRSRGAHGRWQVTRHQSWATRALERVRAAASQDGAGEYRTHCLGTPALLHQAGLVQALAFLRSRKGVPAAYCDDLAVVYGLRDGAELLARAQQAELALYMAITRDVIDASTWLRRFAQSELPAAERRSP